MSKDLNSFQIVKYRNWEFAVDKEFTKNKYGTFFSGGADSCECIDCINFVKNKDSAYPDEVKALFMELGIDYKKESEICHYGQLDNQLHYYGGWFHFKGEISSGPDCRVFHSPETNTFELEKITDNFSIGFTLGNSPTLFESLEGLIQIEFEVKIPWVINEEDY